MNNQKTEIQIQADKYIFQTYGRFPLTLVRGEGCQVWDENGKEYLDFVGGIAVCALGHSSPLITKVLEEQSKTLVHVSNLYYTVPQVKLARLLVDDTLLGRLYFEERSDRDFQGGSQLLECADTWGGLAVLDQAERIEVQAAHLGKRAQGEPLLRAQFA